MTRRFPRRPATFTHAHDTRNSGYFALAMEGLTMTADLFRRFKFFRKWAGYCTPPGRAACALLLARAELAAEQEGLEFRWEDDPDGMPRDGLCSCGCGTKIESCECCVCYGPEGEVLASCGAIWDASTEYRRIMEAELASEALHEQIDGAARAVLPL